MYMVYLFREKATGEVIYVGSSARPMPRLKEHRQQLNGSKKPNKIHQYMAEKNLELYQDVTVEFVYNAESREEMLEVEEEYYFRYIDTIKNERPAENRFGMYNPRKRRVICLNDGNRFKTVSECAKYYGKGRTTISNVLIQEKPYTWINDEKYVFEYVYE